MKTKLFFSFLAILTACTSNKPMTEEQKTAVKNEGSLVVNEFFDALKTSNADKMFKLLTEGPDYTYTIEGEIYTYDQQVELANKYLPAVEKQTFITEFEKYIILDAFCFTYLWKGDNGMYMKSGDTIMLNDYLISYTFRKDEGKWKLVLGQEAASAPFPVDTAMLR